MIQTNDYKKKNKNTQIRNNDIILTKTASAARAKITSAHRENEDRL